MSELKQAVVLEKGGERHAVRAAGPEWLRIVSSAGIVWFHAITPEQGHAPGARWAYGGLPALMAISLAFSAAPTSSSVKSMVWKRTARLGMPWLFWSGVYLVVILARQAVSPRPEPPFEKYMLLTGPALHLWYLPFAWGATILASWLVMRGVIGRGAFAWVGWLAAYVAAFAGSTWLMPALDAAFAARGWSPEPFVQWVFVLPAAVLGVFLALVPREGKGRAAALGSMVGVTLAMAGGCAWLGYDDLARSYVTGATGVALAWMMTGRASRRLIAVSQLSLGVYLVHPLVFGACSRTPGLKENLSASAAVTIAASFLVAAALTRIPWVSKFV